MFWFDYLYFLPKEWRGLFFSYFFGLIGCNRTDLWDMVLSDSGRRLKSSNKKVPWNGPYALPNFSSRARKEKPANKLNEPINDAQCLPEKLRFIYCSKFLILFQRSSANWKAAIAQADMESITMILRIIFMITFVALLYSTKNIFLI